MGQFHLAFGKRHYSLIPRFETVVVDHCGWIQRKHEVSRGKCAWQPTVHHAALDFCLFIPASRAYLQVCVRQEERKAIRNDKTPRQDSTSALNYHLYLRLHPFPPHTGRGQIPKRVLPHSNHNELLLHYGNPGIFNLQDPQIQPNARPKRHLCEWRTHGCSLVCLCFHGISNHCMWLAQAVCGRIKLDWYVDARAAHRVRFGHYEILPVNRQHRRHCHHHDHFYEA